MSKERPQPPPADAGRPPLGPAEASAEIERLRRQMRRLAALHESASAEIDRLNRKLSRAEETLSFQLGYALIRSAKSIDAALSLPATLWALKKEAQRRRGRVDTGPSVGSRVTALVELAARELAAHAGKMFKRSNDE